MRILISQSTAGRYGDRIRNADPAADLVAGAVRDGAPSWTGDPARADVACFTEDLWQDQDMRRHVLPAFFRVEGLRWFHTFSAGVDAPVFQAIIDRGAILTNSSGASAPSIAQYVLAMMLHRAKRIDTWREQQRAHEWQQIHTNELTGQTAGVIGTGAIGGEVARLAKAFNMTVLGVRRSASPAPDVDEMVPRDRLRDLLGRSDYVVLACPLTSDTENLIGEPELRAMKPDATLINIARGRVVNQEALVRALKEGWIGGACLDVFVEEPLPPESPLWDMSNAIVTPHNSGFSPLNMDRSMSIFIDNLARFVRGEELRNRVERAGA
jgi:phosphoglycerate dehydrogenase-like enzyme